MWKVIEGMVSMVIQWSFKRRPGIKQVEDAEQREAALLERLRRLQWELDKELMVIQSTKSTGAGHERVS